jgi:hypothetical protein
LNQAYVYIAIAGKDQVRVDARGSARVLAGGKLQQIESRSIGKSPLCVRVAWQA